jgi:hypothetical protein
MAGRTTCTASEKRSRRFSMLEPGLRNNGLSSERKWEAKEDQRRDAQRKLDRRTFDFRLCEVGQRGLDGRANFVATFLARLISERRESGRSDREARGQGCESLADKSHDLVGHGGCRR